MEQIAIFTSNRNLDRAENLRSVWDAYGGRKEFIQGVDKACKLATDRNNVIVTDEIPGKTKKPNYPPIVFIGHGITGGKVHGVQTEFWVDRCKRINYAICASRASVPIMQMQLGLYEDQILPFGMPRTDAYIGKNKGDGGCIWGNVDKFYLYVPTFRNLRNPPLPKINWDKIDSMLEMGEVLVVKRHILTQEPLLQKKYAHIFEADPKDPSTPYLIDCDVLITDFSSILFDGLVCGKPNVLTIDGYQEYLKSRGMYQKYPEEYSSRWTTVQDNEETWIDYIREANEIGLKEADINCFNKVADMCDGWSSKRVVEFIYDLVS